MASARQLTISLGHDLADQEDAAHDLWSWLPAHRVAKEMRGDYACEWRPGVADVMREATGFISALQDALGEEKFEAVVEKLAAPIREEWAEDMEDED